MGNVFTPNRITTVAGPQINSISQGVYDFRIVVFNNSYHIDVVVDIFFLFVQTATYLFVWGILGFSGRVIFHLNGL